MQKFVEGPRGVVEKAKARLAGPYFAARDAARAGLRWATQPKVRWTAGAVLVYTLAVAGIGISGGLWLDAKGIPTLLSYKVNNIERRLHTGENKPQLVVWQTVNTNRQTLQMATIRVSYALKNGGSLAEAGDNIILSSPEGHFSYLDKNNQIHPIDLSTRMNMDALRNDALYKAPLFNIATVRTLDLLTIKTGDASYDLYASYSRFAGKCFDFVISRVSLKVDAKGVTPVSGWSDVWIANPCVPLKEKGSIFEGLASGGRMVQLTKDTILVSMGDYQFDGFYGGKTVSMDPKVDLGKIVELNIRTGVARHYASGVRNPEGLMIDSKGEIWETEHGPQGGDEVNHIERGKNYGWPIVTYGMVYGSPPTNWPFNPKPGEHQGYERPRFAYVPSIAIGNIIEPDGREFPRWANNLLVLSLKAGTIHILKREGEDIVFDEPIAMGERLRDVIVLHDGRLAILIDGGQLVLVRNAELHKDEPQSFSVTGLENLPRPSVDEAPDPNTESTVELGRSYFQSACASCHTLDGSTSGGPPLNGVVGRKIASAPGFGYSAALKATDGVWTDSRLSAFIDHPNAVVPGTQMPFPGLFDHQTPAVVEFLKTTGGK